jgi:hypothetical protein
MREENLSIYTYDQLLEDSSLVDRAGHAIAAASDCDYLTALERLDSLVNWTTKEGESPKLWEVFNRADTYATREAIRLDREEQRRLDAPPRRVRWLHEGSVDRNADSGRLYRE